nr:ubiquitin [Hymenolepis microstoma]
MILHILVTFRQRILIQLKIDSGLTINKLKDFIEQATGIPSQYQTLTNNGVLLDVNHTIRDYRLPQTVSICLDIPLAYPNKYIIYVKTPFHNQRVKVRVGLEGTIDDLKKAISNHENMSLDHAIIVHNSCVLGEENDAQTLTSLGIREDSEVEIILRWTKFESVKDCMEKVKKEKITSLPPSGFSTMDEDSEVEVGNYRIK